MSIEERVRKVIADHFCVGVDQVKNVGSLKTDFDADSLDNVELTMAFEDEFGIELPDEIASNMDTAQSFIDYALANGVVA
jgi:acyl carrier protein